MRTLHTIWGFGLITLLSLIPTQFLQAQNQPYEQNVTLTICPNESMVFHGKTYFQDGTDDIVIVASDGQDSILHVAIQVLQADTIRTRADISDKEQYVWRADGQSYNTSGLYYIYEKNRYGCDSINILDLHVWPTYQYDTIAEICQAETPLIWHGKEYINSGVYQDRYTTIHGYDSIYTLHLNVNQAPIEDVSLSICHGQSVTYRGKEYNQEGVYFDSDNCERIYRITITETVGKTYTTVAYFDGVTPYVWTYNKKQYLQPNIYTVQEPINGTECYDTHILDLRLGKGFLSEEEAFICEGETYEWHGQKLGQAHIGETYTYYDRYKTREGLDSIYSLKLTIGKKQITTTTLTICNGGSINWMGTTYTTSGVYEQVLHSAQGCDSISRVIVNVAGSYEFVDTLTIVAGESKTWHGLTINNAGEYHQYLRTKDGCDSTYTLHVGVIPARPKPWISTEKITICEDEAPYLWREREYSTTGLYFDSLKTANGGDSIYALNLTIHPIYKEDKNINVNLYTCSENGTISYHGRTWTENDGVTDEWITLKTIHGCDSMVHIFLHFNESFIHEETKTFTNRETYIWHGQEIRSSGDYTASYKMKNGCDSIYILHAIVDNLFIHERDTALCFSEAPFLWHNIEIPQAVGTSSYEFTDPAAGPNGSDIVYRLHVTIYPEYELHKSLTLCEGSTISFAGQTFSEAGNYDITLRTIHGCDSIIHVHVSTESYTYEEHWYWDEQRIYNENTDKWHNLPIKGPGLYEDHYRSAGGCDSIFRLEVHPVKLQNLYFCEGQSVSFNGHYYDHPTRDTLRYQTEEGIDSLLVIVASEYASFHHDEIRYLRDGDSIFWRNDTIYETGYYQEGGLNIYGCDSIYTLEVRRLDEKNTTAVTCTSMLPYPWTWMDQNGDFITDEYNSSGHWEHRVKDIHNHDSILYTLDLTVLPSKDTLIVLYGCRNELVEYQGDIYTESTTDDVDYLFTTDYGCDSTVHLRVVIRDPIVYSHTDTVSEKNLPYIFSTEYLYDEGEYDFIAKSEYGCDSTDHLRLVIAPTFTHNDSVLVCEDNLPYIVGDTTLFPELYHGLPIYQDSVVWSYDKKFFFHVKVRKPTEVILDICEGDSLMLRSEWFYADSMQTNYTVIYDTLPTIHPEQMANGRVQCDSVVRYNVYRHIGYRYEKTVHIADTAHYNFHGRILTAAGTYYDTVQTIYGCDSIEALTLIVDKRYLIDESVHLCLPNSTSRDNKVDTAYVHTFADGHVLNAEIWHSGIYMDSLRTTITASNYQDYTRDYRDSIYRLTVTFDTTYFIQRRYDLCRGDSVQISGKWHSKPGIYTDSLQTRQGCDSIIQWTVNYRNNVQSFDLGRKEIAEQHLPYIWTTRDATAQTEYTHTLWLSGTYRDTVRSHEGCDSILTLDLRVLPTTRYEGSEHYCGTDSISVFTYRFGDGHTITVDTTGIYRDTLHAQLTIQPYTRYDSVIYTLDAHVHRVLTTYRDTTVCRGDSIMFDGRYLKPTSGSSTLTYRTTLKALPTPNDTCYCDSIIEWTIRLADTYLVNEGTVKLAQDSIYHWHMHGKDTVIRTPGTYIDKNTSRYGCDSTYLLTVQVYPTYRYRDSVTICQSELPYYYGNQRNKVFTQVGEFNDSIHYRTVDGMDSVRILYLKVLPVTEKHIYATICQDETYTTALGQVLYRDGLYRDTLTNQQTGCDSIIHYHLSVTPRLYREYNTEITDKDSIFFFGTYLRQPGTYQHVDKAKNGCDSLVTIMNLNVWPSYRKDTVITLCQNELPYEWQGYVINRTCTDSTLIRHYSTVHKADSIFTLHLTVLPTYSQTINVRLCQGESYAYNGKIYDRQGQYQDTLTAMNGCDSIVYTNLTYLPKIYVTHYDTISDQQTYQFYNETLTNSGTYYYYDKLQSGCDSIVELHLTVAPTYQHTDSVAICDSELPYEWQGEKKYERSGTYTHRYTTTMGYDSIYTLKFTVLPTSHTIRHVTICQGDSYTLYNGREVTTGGRYNDTLSSIVNGCDSIITIDLRVLQSHHVEHNYVLSTDSVLDFYGQTVSANGTYVHYGKTQQGCDSIVTIHVRYAQKYFIRMYDEVCYESLPYNWNGRQYYKSTVDTIRYKSTLGQDSIIELTLRVFDEIKMQTKNIGLCNGDSIHINQDLVITAEGVYYDTIRSMHGCDSITKYVVKYYPNFNLYRDRTICHGDTVHFNGRVLTESGDYYARLKTQHGCDSTIHLHLTVHDAYIFETSDLITAEQLPYYHDGKMYRDSGVYETYYSTQNGCDSIYRYILRITDKVSDWQTLYICGDNDSSLVINGQVITRPGEYQFERRSKTSGIMDSLYRVNVVRAHPYEYTIERTICQDTSVTIGNHVFNTTGQYTIHLESQQGCDSIIHLNLTANPRYDLHERLSIYGYECPFYWQGKHYSQTGIYHEEYNTAAGCDSILTLDLTVIETQEHYDTVKICISDLPYRWSRTRKDYVIGGSYSDTVSSSLESHIYYLQLIIVEPTIVTYMPNQQTVCADEISFPIDFTYTGGTPEVYSLYFDAKAKAQGFRNIEEAPYDGSILVPIPQFDIENRYVRPDYYNMQLLLDNGLCDRTLYDVKILVQYPSWIMEQNWSNTVSLLSKDYNGGYTFSGYRWYVDGVYQPDEMNARLRSNLLHPGSEVYVELARQGESYYMPSCPITIEAVDEAASSEIPVLVITPNNTPKDAPLVRIMARENIQYRVFSQSGQMIEEGHMPKGENTLQMPATSGCYFIWAITDSGDATTEKVLVY